MTQIEMRPMSVGEVLDRSFQVLRRGFVPLALTALVGTIPMLLLYLAVGVPTGAATANGPAGGAGFALLIIVLGLVTLASYTVVWGALAHQVDRIAAGEHPSVADGLKAGMSSSWRLIGAGIVLYMLMFAVIMMVGIASAIVIPLAAAGDTVGPALIVGGIGALVLFGWGMVRWVSVAFITLPPVALDGAGPIEAVRRANTLSRGGRMRLCVIAFLAWLLVVLPYFALPLVLGMGTSMWDPAAAGTYSTMQFYVYQVLAFVIGSVTTPFLAATMLFAYYDRRARREAFDLDLAVEPAGV